MSSDVLFLGLIFIICEILKIKKIYIDNIPWVQFTKPRWKRHLGREVKRSRKESEIVVPTPPPTPLPWLVLATLFFISPNVTIPESYVLRSLPGILERPLSSDPAFFSNLAFSWFYNLRQTVLTSPCLIPDLELSLPASPLLKANQRKMMWLQPESRGSIHIRSFQDGRPPTPAPRQPMLR